MIIDLGTCINNYCKKVKNRSKRLKYQCPNCKNQSTFWRHGTYERNVVYWNGKVEEKKICLQRIVCTVCGRTHSILPYDIIPNRCYSLPYLLHLLRLILHQNVSVLWCEKNLQLSHHYIYLILKSFQRCLTKSVELFSSLSLKYKMLPLSVRRKWYQVCQMVEMSRQRKMLAALEWECA